MIGGLYGGQQIVVVCLRGLLEEVRDLHGKRGRRPVRGHLHIGHGHGKGGAAVRRGDRGARPLRPARRPGVPLVHAPGGEGIAGLFGHGGHSLLPAAEGFRAAGVHPRVIGHDRQLVGVPGVIRGQADGRPLAVSVERVAGIGGIVMEAGQDIGGLIQREIGEAEQRVADVLHDQHAVVICLRHRQLHRGYLPRPIREADRGAGRRLCGDMRVGLRDQRQKVRREVRHRCSVRQAQVVGELVIQVFMTDVCGFLIAAVEHRVLRDIKVGCRRREVSRRIPGDGVAGLRVELPRHVCSADRSSHGDSFAGGICLRVGLVAQGVGERVGGAVPEGIGIRRLRSRKDDAGKAGVVDVRRRVFRIVGLAGLFFRRLVRLIAGQEIGDGRVAGIRRIGREVVRSPVPVIELVAGVENVQLVDPVVRPGVVCSAVHGHGRIPGSGDFVPAGVRRIDVGPAVADDSRIRLVLGARRIGAFDHRRFVGDVHVVGRPVHSDRERTGGHGHPGQGRRCVLHLQLIVIGRLQFGIVDPDIVAGRRLAELGGVAGLRLGGKGRRRRELSGGPPLLDAADPVVAVVGRHIAVGPEAVVLGRRPRNRDAGAGIARPGIRRAVAVKERQRFAVVAGTPLARLLERANGDGAAGRPVIIIIGEGGRIGLALEIDLQHQRVRRVRLRVGHGAGEHVRLRPVEFIVVVAVDVIGKPAEGNGAGVLAHADLVARIGIVGQLDQRVGRGAEVPGGVLQQHLELVGRGGRQHIVPRHGHVAGGHGGRRGACAPVRVGGQYVSRHVLGRIRRPVGRVIGLIRCKHLGGERRAEGDTRPGVGIEPVVLAAPVGVPDVQRDAVGSARVIEIEVKALSFGQGDGSGGGGPRRIGRASAGRADAGRDAGGREALDLLRVGNTQRNGVPVSRRHRLRGGQRIFAALPIDLIIVDRIAGRHALERAGGGDVFVRHRRGLRAGFAVYPADEGIAGDGRLVRVRHRGAVVVCRRADGRRRRAGRRVAVGDGIPQSRVIQVQHKTAAADRDRRIAAFRVKPEPGIVDLNTGVRAQDLRVVQG